MGHVLGLVSLLPSSSCSSNNVYTCPKAVEEYSKLNLNSNLFVNGAHWDEGAFPQQLGSSELMTPYFESNLPQPITRVSTVALEESTTDYVVDYSVANSFPYTGSSAADMAFKALVPKTTFRTDLEMDQDDFEPIAI